MKNTRLLFVIWMLFLVLPQGYSQEKKEDSSVLGQVNGFLSKHVKLTAYGQFGYSYTDRKDLDVRQADNQFFGRLGMLILSGDITDKLSWMVQYELFTSQLLELYACYKPYSFFSGQDRSDEDLFYIREPDVTGQCKKLRGKFINCYLCLQIHSLWS